MGLASTDERRLLSAGVALQCVRLTSFLTLLRMFGSRAAYQHAALPDLVTSFASSSSGLWFGSDITPINYRTDATPVTQRFSAVRRSTGVTS